MTTDEFLALPFSGVLEVALKDMRALSTKRGYNFDMGTWVHKASPRVCMVCMAGSVMVNTLNDRSGRPDYLPDTRLGDIMRAINNFRSGYFETALNDFGISVTQELLDQLTTALLMSGNWFDSLPDTVRQTGRAGICRNRKEFVDAYEDFFTPLIAILKQHGL